jgi:hypothetical protein
LGSKAEPPSTSTSIPSNPANHSLGSKRVTLAAAVHGTEGTTACRRVGACLRFQNGRGLVLLALTEPHTRGLASPRHAWRGAKARELKTAHCSPFLTNTAATFFFTPLLGDKSSEILPSGAWRRHGWRHRNCRPWGPRTSCASRAAAASDP